jgi:hypothetical protein
LIGLDTPEAACCPLLLPIHAAIQMLQAHRDTEIFRLLRSFVVVIVVAPALTLLGFVGQYTPWNLRQNRDRKNYVLHGPAKLLTRSSNKAVAACASAEGRRSLLRRACRSYPNETTPSPPRPLMLRRERPLKFFP